MTSRVLILVEGPTEHSFVRLVLAPHLATSGVVLIPTMVTTRRNPRAADYKGGYVPRPKLLGEIRNLLGDKAAHVTMLFDYYRLPGRSPGVSVDAEERRLAEEIGERQRFIPYLQKHEFEALLFSDCRTTGSHWAGARLEVQLERIVSQCGGPEEINDDPATCPSSRLRSLVPDYSKVVDGPTVLRMIGIRAIGQHCPRFQHWIERLTALGD